MRRMRRYAAVAAGLIVTFLLMFAVVEALGVPILTSEVPLPTEAGAGTASLGVGLLVVDVLLPVPSSPVMVGLGAVFGVVGGTLLSLLGSVAAAALAFGLGRRGGGLLDRLINTDERDRADALLARWGGIAIVATRPIPLLAETVAILAGTTSMGWRRLLISSFAGSLPPALAYSLTGASAAHLGDGVAMFGLVLLVTGGFWFAAWRSAR